MGNFKFDFDKSEKLGTPKIGMTYLALVNPFFILSIICKIWINIAWIPI